MHFMDTFHKEINNFILLHLMPNLQEGMNVLEFAGAVSQRFYVVPQAVKLLELCIFLRESGDIKRPFFILRKTSR